MSQRIVCAAMRNAAGRIICSPRHWDTLAHAQVACDPNGDWTKPEQGFVDQRGNFLTRKEAFLIADAAGQIIRRCGGNGEELYSENLY